MSAYSKWSHLKRKAGERVFLSYRENLIFPLGSRKGDGTWVTLDRPHSAQDVFMYEGLWFIHHPDMFAFEYEMTSLPPVILEFNVEEN